jgi:hypothetical protein
MKDLNSVEIKNVIGGIWGGESGKESCTPLGLQIK